MSQTPSLLAGPSSHNYYSQRLRLHYVDWGNPDKPTLLLIHGGRDHCRNWDWVAERFAKDYHIIAPDLRGHGDSQWEQGGTYNQISYVYDIAALLEQHGIDKVTIIGHSLGGGIALMYTSLFPEKVEKLIAIEGMGPSPTLAKKQARKPMTERVRDWIAESRKLSGRLPRRYPSLDDALARMREENPHLSEEQARHLTVHGAHQNEDCTYSWKFDNYVRVFSMSGLPNDEVKKMYGEITCPTLLMRGEESWASDPVADGRTACFNCRLEYEPFANAGHWLHHDQLDKFVARVKVFLQAS